METQTLSYDLCRAYVEDLPAYPWKENVLGKLRARSLPELCGLRELFGGATQSAEEFASLLQIECFFKKNEAFSDEVTCRSAAIQSFLKAEEQCRDTNLRLSIWYFEHDHTDPDFRDLVLRVKRRIHAVLGAFDPFRDSIPERIRFTAGATSTTGRRASKPFLKVKKRYRCPSRGTAYLEAMARYFGYSIQIISDSCNRVEFVPKNWKTHRTIACEPDGSLPFQLAFDSYAKERLRLHRQDLSNQLRNQDLARRGSIDGSYATIDLQGASDSVSLDLIHLLFPREWVEYLLAFRSSFYRGKDLPEGEYAKFSSMGNGTTFALETLVFEACCWAVGSRKHGVYGDDIAVETEYAERLIELLQFFGFTTNQDKTFVEGPYRESCGSHWYSGVPVTPFHVRGKLGLAPFLVHNVNGLSQVCSPEGKLAIKLKELVKAFKLPVGPYTEVSTACVWITSRHALRVGKLRCGNDWRFRFKGYSFKESFKVVTDSRALFLWYLAAMRIPLRKEPLQQSRYTETSERFRVRRLEWHLPSSEEPATLPVWSDFLLA